MGAAPGACDGHSPFVPPWQPLGVAAGPSKFSGRRSMGQRRSYQPNPLLKLPIRRRAVSGLQSSRLTGRSSNPCQASGGLLVFTNSGFPALLSLQHKSGYAVLNSRSSQSPTAKTTIPEAKMFAGGDRSTQGTWPAVQIRHGRPGTQPSGGNPFCRRSVGRDLGGDGQVCPRMGGRAFTGIRTQPL